MKIAGQSLVRRQGLLLCQEIGGRIRWGDAAPLPNLSGESLADVVAAAAAGHWHAFPSLGFAHSSLSYEPSATRIPINSLLMGSRSSILDQAVTASKSSVTAVKLKVARHDDLVRDVELTRQVRARLQPQQRLRLDANRAWPPDEAIDFLTAIQDLDVEYIEEPCQNPSHLEQVFNATGVPYALDETLISTTDLTPFPNVRALVVKPTLLSMATINDLAKHEIALTLSASFESGVGIYHLAALSHRLEPNQPAGIDTYRWLAEDVVSPRLSISNGSINLPNPLVVDESRLTEVCS